MCTEYQFFCPELQREVSTEECYDRGNSGRACYGECCSHVEQAICGIAQEMLQRRYGEQISIDYHQADGLLSIRFHEYLTLEASYDPLYRIICFDAYLHITHGHDFHSRDVGELMRVVGDLLVGRKAFVVQLGWMSGSLRLMERDELVHKWHKVTRGYRTKIIDGRGCHNKSDYLAWLKQGGS